MILTAYIKRYLTILLITVIVSGASAMVNRIDSLKNELQNHKVNDEHMVLLIKDLANEMLYNDVEQSIFYARRAAHIADSIHFGKGYAASMRIIGIYYRLEGNVDSMNMYLGKSLSISKSIKDTIEQINVLNEIGYSRGNNGNYSKSIEAYLEALRLSELVHNGRALGLTYSNLGTVYFTQKQYPEALEYYKKAFKVFQSLNLKFEESVLMVNIAIIHSVWKEYDMALGLYKQALTLATEIDNIQLQVSASTNMAELYYDLKKYDKGISYALRALRLSERNNNNLGIIAAKCQLAKLYGEKGNYQKAIQISNETLKLLSRTKMISIESDIYGVLSEFYARVHNYKDAYQAHIEYKKLNDSIYNESNIKEITTREKQYEFEKEKQEIALEQAKKEAIQEAKLKQQRLLTGVFIGGFVLVLLLVFVILRSLLLKRKANKMLALQKEEITSQAKQLKITNEKLVELDQFKQGMTSMVVHDLKNPLNTIINVADNELTRQAAGQMLNLVLNILDVNKYENTQMIIEKDRLPVYKNLQKAIEQVTFLVERKKILIENKIDKTCWVEGDPVIVERIFVNLLSNAVKYTPVNGNIEVSGDIDEKNGNVVISVKDTGKGIPKEYHDKVFEKFAQIDAKNTGNLSSTGLGLTFCKIAVEAHGGKIWIDNSYSEGTCISFMLPVSYVSQEIIDEQIIASNSNQLTKQESQVLQKYLPQFLKLEFYEITAFRKLFHEIEKEGKVNSGWLQQLKDAVDYENRTQFENLINSHI